MFDRFRKTEPAPGVAKHFNFFRYHLLSFTILPLVFSGIFYAANGTASPSQTEPGVRKVEYIDCLFLCFSAMTVTGIVTVNISTLQPSQQVLLLILFIIGDFSFVSLIMVLVRKRFFRKYCEELLRRSDTLPRSTTKAIFDKAFTLSNRVTPFKTFKGGPISGPLNARPLDDYAAERVMESPNASMGSPVADIRRGSTMSAIELERRVSALDDASDEPSDSNTADSSRVHMYGQPSASPRTPGRTQFNKDPPPLRPTRTIQIVEPYPLEPTHTRQLLRARTRGNSISLASAPALDFRRRQSLAMRPTSTMPTSSTHAIPVPDEDKTTGFGGFPSPLQLVGYLISENAFEALRHRFARPERTYTLLMNRTATIAPTDPESAVDEAGGWDDVKAAVAKWMPDKVGGLVVGRNSRFFTEELDDEQLEQLGGVEYRALRLLSYLVPGYIVVSQLIPFAVIAIYFHSTSRWNYVFNATSGTQQATVNKSWTSFFLVVSAYAGCGMSLIDQGMLPFQGCYVAIFALVAVLLLGNHVLPMMLRFIIWISSKIWRKGKTNETLHFLLDHPRRCFLYLFPSHQTWYLILVLIAFIGVEMFGYLVLNIGLPILTESSGFRLFTDAMLQNLSVRAAGFGVVPIATMAPAVLFLYTILMYVAIYPIAMSVRSTNVYEERALGVYEEKDPDMVIESEPTFQGKKHEVFSKYLAWHVRRQLAFDIWPLTLAIFLICIVERNQLLDPAKSSWFTIFRVIFECTSAYATIGLSMGTPNNNYSFTGELRTLSKLIMILIMLRGRHRGLPVAIDRAILLPQAYTRFDRRATMEAETRAVGENGREKSVVGAEDEGRPKTA